VTIEALSQSVVDGAVDEPSCEDLVKDDALTGAEANPNHETKEPESNNSNDEVIESKTPLPTMSDADMLDTKLDDEFLDDEFLDDVEVSSYPTASQETPQQL
jgi:hypothetical protein